MRTLALLIAALLTAPAAAQAPAVDGRALNARFLADLAANSDVSVLQVERVRRGWETSYRDARAVSFIPDALAELYPDFATALSAYDTADAEQAAARFALLRTHADPYVRACATWFEARALLDLNRHEEVEQLLTAALADEELLAHAPHAQHLQLLLAVAASRNLRFDAARAALEPAQRSDAAAPEPLRVATRQLLLELGARNPGTLDEAAEMMHYVADRLRVVDTRRRTREKQQEILDLLDQLIQEQEAQDQQQQSSSRQSQQQQRPRPMDAPQSPKDQSDAPLQTSRDDIPVQNEVDQANPGEVWGKLPPKERERILQVLRERFPSRYRQLVEQYYRSLAEQPGAAPPEEQP